MKKIYLASPFFDENEKNIINKVMEILKNKDVEVFLPMEHQNKHLEFGSLEWRAATFKSDVDAIDECDVMLAIITKGNYDDTGTSWEVGYAYAKGKDVVVLKGEEEALNLMIADSVHSVLNSYEQLENFDFEKMERVPYLEYVW